MSTPTTLCALLDLIRRGALIPEPTLTELAAPGRLPTDLTAALDVLVKDRLLTRFHAQNLLKGKYKGFVLGPYKVMRPIGHGGMGIVYLAEHTHLPWRVAIKVIRRDRLDRQGVADRFEREARIATALDHPHLVKVHEYNPRSDPPYLVMEYVEGKSLRTLLKEKGRIPPAEAVGYAIQAARGLQHAHERGVVHRDVKPANLLVTPDGTVKVLDLGLARFDDARHDRLTERLGGNSLMGSADFLAPETVDNPVDHRGDIYSLGATLYTLILGEPPFPRLVVGDRVSAHRLMPVRPLHERDAGVPERLSLVVLRMLAKNPEQRYQTLDEVLAALEGWETAVDEAAPPVGPSRRRQKVAVAAAVAVGVGVVLGIAGWAVLTWPKGPTVSVPR